MVETNSKNTSTMGQRFSPTPTSAPAEKRKKRRSSVSEYKRSLQEKQTLKRLYGLSEKQFKKYVKGVLEKRHKVENVSEELIKKLEKRLDNVIFRLGFAKTRRQSRQLVSHAYFLINSKSVNIPSFQVSKGDVVNIKGTKIKKIIFEELESTLKKTQVPVWLNLDVKKFEAKIIGEPTLSEVNPPVEISLVFEFYSR